MTSTEFLPLSDRILILPEVVPEKTKGGLYLPEQAKERPVRGTVVAVGPGRWSEELKEYVKPLVDAGDEVLYSQFAGTDITLEDGRFVIMRADDVFGKWRKQEQKGKKGGTFLSAKEAGAAIRGGHNISCRRYHE